MIDSTPPRPIESTEPPADEEATRRHHRVSRHQLRLPNDLTCMDATDDRNPSADATATQPDGGSPAALPPEPPPLDGAPTDLRPPSFASVNPSQADVEVTLDTANTVSVPPPPMSTQSTPPVSVDPAASHNGVMRVVRRRVRMVGVDESGNPTPASMIPATAAPDTTVTVPHAPLPTLPDLGLDFSDTVAKSEEPPPLADPGDRVTRLDAAPPPAVRVVTPPPVPAIRVDESVPKRPSSPPPPRRPSNPPPPMAPSALASPAPTTQDAAASLAATQPDLAATPAIAAASSSPPSALSTPTSPAAVSTPPAAQAATSTPPAATSTPPASVSTPPASTSTPPASTSSPPAAQTSTATPPLPPAAVLSRAAPGSTITIPVGGPPPFPSPGRASQPPPKADAPKALTTPATAEAPAPAAPAASASDTPPPAPETSSADDESVEVSLDEHSDAPDLGASSRPPRGVDPSLALLDELAELGHATPVESVDPDAIEHVEAPATARNTSMPPPPPTDASRKGKTNNGTVKITGGPTLPDAKPRRRRMWWEELFNEDYFRTVEKLTPQQVQTEADWIEHALGVEAGASILDVGCGAGRQAIELSTRRYEVSAVDLSVAMLTRAAEAAQDVGARVAFTQVDMAAMDFSEKFDAAYCVGSTFGFFDDPRNAEVARRIHRALKPHGTFLLAVPNRDHVIQHQPAMSWFEGEGCVCMEESAFNYITSRVNVKRTMIYDDGRQREFEYSVRLYSLHELGQVLHEAGFRILEVSGHTRTPGAFFGPSSRELIILAQKRAPEVVELGDNAADSSRPQ